MQAAKLQQNIQQLLHGSAGGDARAIARAITTVENDLPGAAELLQGLQGTAEARVIGITGPPGAGKSTLVNALLDHWTAQDLQVAVVAVDPSSPFHHGALLGDRIRMSRHYNDPRVFIRSLASRGALGGLHPRILEVTDVLRHAPFDRIVIETVGVGQSEVEIASLADCTVVALVPEAGDSIQTIKAGLMEIADVFVVNKADRDDADSLYRHLRVLAHEGAGADGWERPVYKTSATTGSGVSELAGGIDRFLQTRQGNDARRLQLLAAKAWRLLEARSMRGQSRAALGEALAGAVSRPGFNLYAFVHQYPLGPSLS